MFLLGIVVLAPLIGISQGGDTAIISAVLLAGIVGYLAWAHKSNPASGRFMDSHLRPGF